MREDLRDALVITGLIICVILIMIIIASIMMIPRFLAVYYGNCSYLWWLMVSIPLGVFVTILIGSKIGG